MTSDNENQYTDANGVRYEAREKQGACFGCAIFDQQSWWIDCASAPCVPLTRADKRSIIWIKAK